MNALDQQVNVSLFSEVTDKLLLHLVQVIEGQFLGNLRWWRKTGTFRGTLIEALQPCLIDGFAHRLATAAAEMPRFPIDLSDYFSFRGNRQAAVKAGFLLGLCHGEPALWHPVHTYTNPLWRAVFVLSLFDADQGIPGTRQGKTDLCFIDTRFDLPHGH